MRKFRVFDLFNAENDFAVFRSLCRFYYNEIVFFINFVLACGRKIIRFDRIFKFNAYYFCHLCLPSRIENNSHSLSIAPLPLKYFLFRASFILSRA